MKKTKAKDPDAPRCPSFSMECGPAFFAEVPQEHRSDNLRFSHEVSDTDLSGHEFYECAFTDITFAGKYGANLFADAVFDHCDFSNADFQETVIRRAVFRGCRMTGTDFTRSTLEDAVFENCTCSYANFSGSRFRRCAFENVQCRESAFSLCRLEKFRIRECDFTGAEFLDTKLKDLDFSDSTIQGILVNADGLKGIIVSAEQAVACAKLLGIRVKE